MNVYSMYLCAGPEQECSVVQEEYSSGYLLLKVMVDDGQTCFLVANVACNVTDTSGNGRTTQPVSCRLEHSSFNITGFERCHQYLISCHVQHEGYQPAVCKAIIEELMSRCSCTSMNFNTWLCYVTFGYILNSCRTISTSCLEGRNEHVR